MSVSIVLPVYNGGEYLKLSVQSVLEQSSGEFELLICDDCSTDGSYEYLSSLHHPSVQLFRNEKNKGLFPTLNFLVGQASFPLIKLWSQDDIMRKDCIEKVISFHRDHPEIGFSYSGVELIDGSGRIIPLDFIDNTPTVISKELHARIAFYTGSIAGNISNVAISKKALLEVGVFDEKMKIAADFDMWVRLAEHHPVGRIKEKLIFLRNHSGQLSRAEKYYLYHLKEDKQVYDKLMSYVDQNSLKEGKRLLYWNKYVFYFTLMVKAFVKLRWRTAWLFCKELSEVDSVFLLGCRWLLIKSGIKKRLPANNNSFLFEKING